MFWIECNWEEGHGCGSCRIERERELERERVRERESDRELMTF